MGKMSQSGVGGAKGVGRWPNFILIGAMKSGTTTFYEYLCRHPKVFMCTPKEPQYFSKESKFLVKEDWYRSLFAEAQDDQICGEASACYSRWPHFGDVAGRIAQHVPEVKLIYLMRHPVDRAYSHYRHMMEERTIHGEGPIIPVEQALEEIGEIVDASLYLQQIEQYLKCFSRDRFLFLLFDDLKKDPAGVLDQTQRFLGLDPIDLLAHGPVAANEWGDRMRRVRAKNILNRLRATPGFSLLKRVVPEAVRGGVRSWLTNSKALSRRGIESHKRQIPSLTAEVRRKLVGRFAEPTRNLEKFLDRSLDGWLE